VSEAKQSSHRRSKCPACKKEGDWFSGPYGPFCSHRCKLVDLGKWLGEEHRISEPLSSDALKKSDEVSPLKSRDNAEPDESS